MSRKNKVMLIYKFYQASSQISRKAKTKEA